MGHTVALVYSAQQFECAPIAAHPTEQDCSQVSLERVCFNDVASSVDILDSPDSRRNVTTHRGALSSLPLHFEADVCTPVKAAVANFALDISRAQSPPVVAAALPRRRARLARKSRHRASKPAIQAQNVLMKRLGMAPNNTPLDASSYQRFVDTFSATLSESQCEAMDELLPNAAPMTAAIVSEPLDD